MASEPPLWSPGFNYGAKVGSSCDADTRSRCCKLARALGDTLCRAAQPPKAYPGHLEWVSAHPLNHGLPARDINIGTSGSLLALAEIVAELNQTEHRLCLVKAARSLVTHYEAKQMRLPGLYVGEAGIGAALLRAGQVLKDNSLIIAALEVGRFVSSLPHSSPDLFNGSAGRACFHIWMWDETDDPEQLRAAVKAGEYIVQSAMEAADEGLSGLYQLDMAA